VCKRSFRLFSHKNATCRIASACYDSITAEIIKQRALLEEYIGRYPLFGTALEPVTLVDNPPPIARIMADAAEAAGVGPMAAVAGAIAQMAARVAIEAGAAEAIVENGGDLYLHSDKEVIVGLFAGTTRFSAALAFRVAPAMLPRAICSSSGTMGHSLSFGACDLATVVSRSAALADAAATRAGNLVKTAADIPGALNTIVSIPGVDGALLIKDDKLGMAGELPELVKNTDAETIKKITREKGSLFPGFDEEVYPDMFNLPKKI